MHFIELTVLTNNKCLICLEEIKAIYLSPAEGDKIVVNIGKMEIVVKETYEEIRSLINLSLTILSLKD